MPLAFPPIFTGYSLKQARCPVIFPTGFYGTKYKGVQVSRHFENAKKAKKAKKAAFETAVEELLEEELALARAEIQQEATDA
jgi:hypothetical protein